MKHKCVDCGWTLSRDEAGLNKKLINRNVVDMRCIDCLAEHLDTTVGELEERIEEWRDSGCKLFL